MVERFHHSTQGVPMQVGNCSRLQTVDLSVPQEPLYSSVKLGMARSHPFRGLTITHNFRALREQPKGQVGDNKKGAADNTL